jgi:hypothetical protein
MEPFTKISWLDFPAIYSQNIIQEITSKGKEYILKVDENEFINYLVEKYRLEPLKILYETENISTPIKSQVRRNNTWGEQYKAESLTFRLTYNFEGSADLFSIRPNPYTYASYDIDVNGNSKTVSFNLMIYRQDAEEFKKEKSKCYSNAFTNLENVNNHINQFNLSFESNIKSLFLQEKNIYKAENDFFAAINIKVNENTKSIFTAPTIQKKIITQPQVQKNKEFSSEPTMSKEMYDDVLKVIYDSGKSMEKKPALYIGKNEEGLRDQFLFVLETRYEGTTATGETFNRGGKADIILKFADDGSNLFIAECKFWHGSSEFLKAISQLFDRYLTWRDSKVAIIMFSKNKDFSSVLKTIKDDITSHEYFIKYIGDKGESSFSYEFHIPQDKEKKVEVEIMAFHFDKE